MQGGEKEVVQNPFDPPSDEAPPDEDDGEDDQQNFCGTLVEEKTKVSNSFPNPVERDLS